MKLEITNVASQWFQSEMDLKAGDAIRFFGKVYGKTGAHDGFSMGLERSFEVKDVYAKTQKDGITYYVANTDDWFFNNLDLVVDYDAKLDEPKYDFSH